MSDLSPWLLAVFLAFGMIGMVLAFRAGRIVSGKEGQSRESKTDNAEEAPGTKTAEKVPVQEAEKKKPKKPKKPKDIHALAGGLSGVFSTSPTPRAISESEKFKRALVAVGDFEWTPDLVCAWIGNSDTRIAALAMMHSCERTKS